MKRSVVTWELREAEAVAKVLGVSVGQSRIDQERQHITSLIEPFAAVLDRPRPPVRAWAFGNDDSRHWVRQRDHHFTT